MARSWPVTKDQTPHLAIRRCNTRKTTFFSLVPYRTEGEIELPKLKPRWNAHMADTLRQWRGPFSVYGWKSFVRAPRLMIITPGM